jgi:hypothetical protein
VRTGADIALSIVNPQNLSLTRKRVNGSRRAVQRAVKVSAKAIPEVQKAVEEKRVSVSLAAGIAADQDFGKWCKDQKFRLHRTLLHRYRLAAEFAVDHDLQQLPNG